MSTPKLNAIRISWPATSEPRQLKGNDAANRGKARRGARWEQARNGPTLFDQLFPWDVAISSVVFGANHPSEEMKSIKDF